MDIKAYIESGIIERYVLGHVSPQEKQEVECMSHIYAEIADELRSIESSLEQIAIKGAVTPPAHLKASIMERIKSEEQVQKDSKKSEAKIIAMNTSTPTSKLNKYLAAAVVFLAIGIGGILILTNQQQSSLNQQLNATNDRLDSLNIENAQLQTTLVATNNDLIFIKDAQTMKVLMNGTPAHSENLATVYWNTTSKKVLLEVNNLSTPPSDKQFQLWAIVNGQPQDMGVFDINTATAFLEMNETSDAQAFAITLEPKGGSASPSLDQMYVIGTI